MAPSPVRFAKFQSIRYFIDINILQNSLIDIDIDIDMDFLENIDIYIDKEILQNININEILYRLEFGISKRATHDPI